MLKVVCFLAGHLRPLYIPIALNLGAMAAQSISFIAVFFLLDSFLRSQVTSSEIHAIISLLSLVFLFIIYCILIFSYVRKSMIETYKMIAALRIRVCDHLRTLSFAFFRTSDPAVISGSLLHDMNDTEAVFGIYIYEIIACFAVPVIIGAIMVFMNWKISLSMFGVILLSIPIAIYSFYISASDSPKYVQMRSKVDTTILEYVGGISELKGADRTGESFSPFTQYNNLFLSMAIRMETKFGVLGQLFQTMLDLSLVSALLTGSYFFLQQQFELSIFLFFILVSYRLIDPLQNLGVFLTEFRFLATSMERIAKILHTPPLAREAGFTKPKDNSFVFQDVSFGYGDQNVLENISFVAHLGTVTALVGESGGGKTTIANILLRFWDVKKGMISIGGTDIRSFELDELYKNFSIVFQDVYLFNDTVMNNIRLANPDAMDSEVIDAAKRACCHEFITNLEHGYNTIVGEKGSRLAGGERQRIAIARAILKDAPILILDEATASVDPENELLIQQGLNNLMRGKTLLVIAHRLTTIRNADQILVIKSGRIIERGTHDVLYGNNGEYKKQWDHQEKIKSWKLQRNENLLVCV
ncbi:MAG: ABC transporter ATP-binding protein/permease [Desulfovibrio sp.]|jgi:ATP-binding cassette subfamily B protein|nr:ABC transporter ATP-binding protein/permease [Desulfovibrio sp.]